MSKKMSPKKHATRGARKAVESAISKKSKPTHKKKGVRVKGKSNAVLREGDSVEKISGTEHDVLNKKLGKDHDSEDESSEDEAVMEKRLFAKRKEAVQRGARTGRATRSTGNNYLLINNDTGRTPMQAERDLMASNMPKEWIPNNLSTLGRAESNIDPRGIENPNNHCYWNAMLQNLMHVPIFLHWIRTHNQADNCLVIQGKRGRGTRAGGRKYCTRCEVKRLVEEYWGPNPPSNPIPRKSRALCRLKSNAWNLTNLVEDHQEDAQEAFLFLANDEYGIAKGDDLWKTQFNTIFQVYNVPFDTCRRCGIERENAPSLNDHLVVSVHNSHTTLQEAIDASFTALLEEWACPTEGCAGSIPGKHGPPQDRRWVIRAAPRVLNVQLLIFDYRPGEGLSKITHALHIGDRLDLTRHQENSVVPLKYQLSGVVAHSGESIAAGHYVASVRSPGANGFWSISDDVWKVPVSMDRFTDNPQPSPLKDKGDGEKYYVYMLTYTRDETSLDVLNRRTVKELKG